MAISTYASKLILDHLVFQAPFTVSQFYLSLHTQAPPSTGTPSFEVTSTEYARQAINFDANYQNTNEIVWGPTSETWGNIASMGLVDNSSGGTIFSTASVSINITSFVIVRIAVGQITISLS